MTHRDRMLAALRGEPTDRIPWAPRLDLWYRANRQAGSLPEAYRDLSLMELTDAAGMGYHAVVPEFRDLRGPGDDIDRALGIYNLHPMPYQTVLDGIDRRRRIEGDRTVVEYRTPLGDLRTVTLYDQAMREAGVSITHVVEYAFKNPADYEPLGWLFEHARAVPQYDGFEAFDRRVGPRGLPAGFVSLAASPMHLIQRELMPLDTFFYEMHDHPEALERLAERIGGYWRRVMDVAVESPARVLLLGANYDASVTHPPFFERHILPWLARYAEALHARGKFLLTHTDGENTGLLDYYLASGIDIADSICPAPMTKLTFGRVRERFDGRIAIMGGIPSVALLPSVMPQREFEEFLDDFFEQIGRGDRLILGVSDTTPPGADWSRLEAIGRRVEAFGPVR